MNIKDDMDTTFDIGIDIGGSHICVGFVGRSTHHIIDKKSWKVNENCCPEDAIHQISNSIYEMSNQISSKCISSWSIGVVGIGCPGQAKNGVLINAANLPKFRNTPLASMLSNSLNKTLNQNDINVVLLNDADAAIFAELKSCKSKHKYENIQNACMISIGTGIGVSIYLSGTIFHGSNGMIEAGHMIIDYRPDARQCGCGQVPNSIRIFSKGCVEAYASAKSTCLRMIEKDKNSFPSSSTGSQDNEMNAKAVFDRAANGDSAAIEVLDLTLTALGIMCINLCRMVDPEVIILAGGMALAGETFRQKVEESMHRSSWTVLPTEVKIALSYICDDSGMIGAAIAAYEISKQLL